MKHFQSRMSDFSKKTLKTIVYVKFTFLSNPVVIFNKQSKSKSTHRHKIDFDLSNYSQITVKVSSKIIYIQKFRSRKPSYYGLWTLRVIAINSARIPSNHLFFVICKNLLLTINTNYNQSSNTFKTAS